MPEHLFSNFASLLKIESHTCIFFPVNFKKLSRGAFYRSQTLNGIIVLENFGDCVFFSTVADILRLHLRVTASVLHKNKHKMFFDGHASNYFIVLCESVLSICKFTQNFVAKLKSF